MNYQPSPYFKWALIILLCILLGMLSGCGGGGGNGKDHSFKPHRYTKADLCAALMDSIHHPALHPHSDWTEARSKLPASDPVLVAEYDEMGYYNYEYKWMERTACYSYVNFIPAWDADKETIARRMAEMAADIRGQCEGDETIGEC